ncbi:MAG: hypothetical protein NT080_11165 [Spirochaetes bacterium]|nr:hypothetical protein [Spirochaetota bacterium]
MYPILYRLVPASRILAFMDTDSDFPRLVADTTGNPLVWLANLFLSAGISFKFYREWLLEDKL